MNERQDLQSRVDSVPWYHSIDFGEGIRSQGRSQLDPRFEYLPEFSGKSVLDIGTWDGLYAFYAERKGARRVVAIDDYAWMISFEERDAYWSDVRQAGSYVDPLREKDFYDPSLPGMAAFRLAKELLNSSVEPVACDFMTADPDVLGGPFDVTLFMGVLYHLQSPYGALQKVRQLTKRGGVAVIESLAVIFRDVAPEILLAEYVPKHGPVNDFSVWWVPTEETIVEMCKAAGFVDARIVTEAKPTLSESGHPLRNTVDRRYARTHARINYRVIVVATA